MILSRTERLLAELGIVIMAGCLAGVLGLFSPAGTALGSRLAFAVAGCIAAWGAVRVIAIIGTASARLLGLGSVWGYVFAVPVASALIAWSVLWLIGGSEAALGDGFAQVWPQTLAISAGFFALFFVIYWRAYSGDPPTGETAPRSEVRPAAVEAIGVAASGLHDRLPPHFPAIIALTVEDHYVRVLAEERSEMLLMSLAEAVELMPQDSGKQVHRSWWVAQSAITGHRREGRDLRLRLSNGIEAPVSRAMVKPLREAGWL